jgi:hypothetical protein
LDEPNCSNKRKENKRKEKKKENRETGEFLDKNLGEETGIRNPKNHDGLKKISFCLETYGADGNIQQ